MNAVTSTGLLLAALALAFAGFLLLAITQRRRWPAISGCDDKAPAGLGRAGWALVLCSSLPCLYRDTPGVAALLWPLVLAVAAWTVVIVLTWYRTGLERMVGRLVSRSRAEE